MTNFHLGGGRVAQLGAKAVLVLLFAIHGGTDSVLEPSEYVPSLLDPVRPVGRVSVPLRHFIKSNLICCWQNASACITPRLLTCIGMPNGEAIIFYVHAFWFSIDVMLNVAIHCNKVLAQYYCNILQPNVFFPRLRS